MNTKHRLEPSPTTKPTREGSDNYLIIAHPSENKILIASDGTGHSSLPLIRIPENGPWWEVGRLTKLVNDEIKIQTSVLRCVAGDDNLTQAGARVYTLEAHSIPESLGENVGWVARKEATEQSNLPENHRALLNAWFTESETGQYPITRAPWARPGWFASAIGFAKQTLSERNSSLLEVQQQRTWERSSVIKLATSEGPMCLKACPSMYAFEPVLTQMLAKRFPLNTPEVIQINEQKKLLLMRWITGRPLSESREIKMWESALSVFAEMQIGFIDDTAKLKEIGCTDLATSGLSTKFLKLVSDRDTMLIGRTGGLTSDEAKKIDSLSLKIERACANLSALGIPDSFEHGDFRAEHILVDNGCPIIFDLSNTVVTHPFFSAVQMIDFENAAESLPGHLNARSRLLKSYLEPWTSKFGPMEQLIEGFEIARPLAALKEGLIRATVNLPHLEHREKWEFMIPYWMKKFIELSKS